MCVCECELFPNWIELSVRLVRHGNGPWGCPLSETFYEVFRITNSFVLLGVVAFLFFLEIECTRKLLECNN